jgi:hypothetical protein
MRLLTQVLAASTALGFVGAQLDGWAPPVHAKRPGNNGFSTPGNWSKGRSQNIYNRADLPPNIFGRPLVKLQYRGSQYPSLIDTAFAARMLPAVQIGIGNTTTSGMAMVSTFATNVPADNTVVFPTGPINLPASNPVGVMAESRAETMVFMFTTPKIVTGPNLFVEFTFSDPVLASVVYWSDALDNRATILNGHNAHRGQGGCGVMGPGTATRLRAPSSASGNGLGTTTTFSLSNATVNSPYLFFVGAELEKPYGQTAPFDLAPFGAPGCPLWNTADITLNGTTTASGTASIPVPIPNNPALSGKEVGIQMLVLSPGYNPAGVTTSNGIGAWLGARYPLTSGWVVASNDLIATGTVYNGGAQIVHLFY